MNNPCAHKCLDTGVAIECSCHPGYKLASDKRSCIGKLCDTSQDQLLAVRQM
jgi:hypothetical protein